MMGLERMERMRIFTDELTAVASPTFRSPVGGRRTGDGAESSRRRSASLSGAAGWQAGSPLRSERSSAAGGAPDSEDRRRWPPWLKTMVRPAISKVVEFSVRRQ